MGQVDATDEEPAVLSTCGSNPSTAASIRMARQLDSKALAARASSRAARRRATADRGPRSVASGPYAGIAVGQQEQPAVMQHQPLRDGTTQPSATDDPGHVLKPDRTAERPKCYDDLDR